MLKLYDFLRLKDSYGELTDKDRDPGNDDVEYIVYVAKSIPKTAEDIRVCDFSLIGANTLSAMFMLNDLHAKSIAWAAERESDLNIVLGRLLQNVNIPATVREKVSKGDAEYKIAFDNFKLAEAYAEFYTKLLATVTAAHYWARNKEAINNTELKMLGYDVK